MKQKGCSLLGLFTYVILHLLYFGFYRVLRLYCQTSLKWLTVAMPLLETNKRETRLERDKRETREIWSYGGWPIIV